MRTDDLIDALADRLEPVSPNAPWRRLFLWVTAGLAVSAALMLTWLGPRPDFMLATRTMMFWVKFAYTLALGCLALWAAERLGRPGLAVRRPAMAWLLVVATAALIAAVELASAPPPMRGRMLMGHSAMLCPWRILALAVPLLIGALAALRTLAPTRPALTGLAGGLAAGGLAAFIYAFSCDESAMPFVALCYTLPILAAGLVGATAGRFALRW